MLPVLKYFDYNMSEKEIVDRYATFMLFDEKITIEEQIEMDKECRFLIHLLDTK